MSRIVLIAALPGELKPLVRGWRHEQRGGVELWRQSHRGAEWIAACAGMGAASAVNALAEAEKDGPADQIFSIGWAGALSETMTPGRAYSVAGVIDGKTGERFATAGPANDCWLLTSRTVLGETEKRALASEATASLVDMEAVALARIAAARGIPFRGVKGVSDGLADRLPDFNRFISAQGKFRLAAFISFVLRRPWFWPALIRLNRHSGRAAREIKALVLAILEKETP